MLRAAEANPRNGLVHAIGFYGSDDEFGRAFAPFCEAGVRAGEATVVRLEERKVGVLRSLLGDCGDIVFLPHENQYPHAPGALASVLELLDRHTAGGGRPLRLLGELPPMTGLGRDAWMRYEAAVNHLLSDLPVAAVCACDTRTTPEAVQAEMLRNHQTVVAAGGRQEASTTYDASAALPGHGEPVRDPLEETPPSIGLLHPSPMAARQAVTRLAGEMGLDVIATDALRVGVSEAVSNAIIHGRPPVLLQAWGGPGRVVVAVRDAGDGPADPLVGLLPGDPDAREGGLGLWITHQLCPETALASTNAGFTVRMAAGEPADVVPT